MSLDPADKLLQMRNRIKDKPGVNFPFLSDLDHRVIDRYGLLNDKAQRPMPHPATLVIDKAGIVRWRFIEVDYKVRPSNETVLQELMRLPADSSMTFDNVKLVREFIAAFNQRKLDRMLELADNEIQWLSINGVNVAVETKGKQALKESMAKYFRDCPSCQSSLEWVQCAGSRVAAQEKASWTGMSGLKEQSSLSTYELRNGKILRVYYFPAETEAKPK